MWQRELQRSETEVSEKALEKITDHSKTSSPFGSKGLNSNEIIILSGQ
jgi:hypothetical protein